MKVRFFRGRECGHKHEHRQLTEIVHLLGAEDGDEEAYLLTGVRTLDGELDCALLLRSGFVILELKAFCGDIYGQENGIWQVKTEDGTLVSLHNKNLFEQLEKERYNFIDAVDPLIADNIRDIDGSKILNKKARRSIISAWGYFLKGSTYPPGQIDPARWPWFAVVTADTLMARLKTIESPLNGLPRYLDGAIEDLMNDIVERLHLDEYDFETGTIITAAPLPDLTPASPEEPLPEPEKQCGLNEYRPTSRSHALILLKAQLAIMDANLEEEAMEIPPGPQRIRGIAGSGKTRLLCQKAAYMHVKHPEWDIALVFQTRALYPMIEDRIRRSVSAFGGVWDRKKLQILHAWGGHEREGFYSLLCHAHGIIPENIQSLKQKRVTYELPQEMLAYCCCQLLDRTGIKPLFDAILIDEGQDLVVDNPDLLHKGRQPIYALAYETLRPADPASPELRRLIWAYDEYQNTSTMRIPTAPELFGYDSALKNCTFGTYRSGIKKSIIMRSCWRTPGPVITAAHAVGMGLLFKRGMIAGPRRRTEWEALGYTVSGAFRSNHRVVLSRTREHSGNAMPRIWSDPLIELETFSSRQEELSSVAERIKKEIEEERIDPSESILVISMLDDAAHVRKIAEAMRDAGVNVYIASAPAINTLSFSGKEASPDRFREDYAVTVCGINRAKGNEADHVYLVSLDYIARNDESINLRNRLFVGMTRTRAWVTMTGIGSYPLYDEIKRAIEGGEEIAFTYRDSGAAYIPGDEEEALKTSYQQELT